MSLTEYQEQIEEQGLCILPCYMSNFLNKQGTIKNHGMQEPERVLTEWFPFTKEGLRAGRPGTLWESMRHSPVGQGDKDLCL